MADSVDTKDSKDENKAADSSGAPAPEVLKPKVDTLEETPEKSAGTPSTAGATRASARSRRHGTHRPSHKATFIGIAVVLVILALNVGIFSILLKNNSKNDKNALQDEVVINTKTLDKLGVNRNETATEGTELVVTPDARFSGKLKVKGDVGIAGQLILNSKFSAADASLTKLDAGSTSVSQLNVNGDGTATTLNLRKDLNVAGDTKLQGNVTISKLLTIINNLNVSGNLAVGGTISARSFQASSLISDSTLRVGGHIITQGSAPGVSGGPATGNNGTVSISGSDTAGTIAINAGTGAGNGTLASVSFRSAYGGTPRVVVTAVGPGMGSLYVSRSASGFSVGVNGAISPGGYAIDYIVVQ